MQNGVSSAWVHTFIQLISFKRSAKCRLSEASSRKTFRERFSTLRRSANVVKNSSSYDLWPINSNLFQKHFCKQEINLPWIYDFLQMLLNARCDKCACQHFICERCNKKSLLFNLFLYNSFRSTFIFIHVGFFPMTCA